MIGLALAEPPGPEIPERYFERAEEDLLNDTLFLASFVTSDDEVYKRFERKVIERAAALYDHARAEVEIANSGNDDA